MNHHTVQNHSHHTDTATHTRALNKVALSATLHCLTGCSIGEVLGMVLGTAFGWSKATTIMAAVLLAFIFGYSLTLYHGH